MKLSYYQRNKERICKRIAEKKKNNPEYAEKLKNYLKSYHSENKEDANEKMKEYWKKNKDYFIEKNHKEGYWKNYYENNKDEIFRKQKLYLQNNLQAKLAAKIRQRIGAAMRRQYYKSTLHSKELLGCTYLELSIYLEKQFKDGMTWENYGKWHIDHIRPCCSFDLSKLEEQKKCFHYTNLQPLWAKDNLKKGMTY